MDVPSWQDTAYGSMKRAALWLVTEIGPGEVFTKTQLREAFPEVAQIDRRMRDLRDYDWKIDTNREDPGLEAAEQRFVRQGAPVWEPGATAGKKAEAITATHRRDLIRQDGNICRSCGIAPGQHYTAGTYETAQLDIARRAVKQADGSTRVELVAECNRCRIGGRELAADLSQILADLKRLGALERSILAEWVEADRRGFSAIERLWGEYRSLPEESRSQVREALHPGV